MSDIRPLPVDFRYHLLELSGNELQVWMFYYLSTGDELTAHPSIETLATYTGLSDRTIKVCKRRLVIKGWMCYTGDSKQPRSGHGQFDVPIMELRLPWRPDWSVVVAELSLLAEIHRGAIISLPTVVQTLHPEGSVSCSGSGSAFDSRSDSASHASSSSDLSLRQTIESVSESKDGRKAKPEPKPKAANGHGKRVAADGTPYPGDFDWPSWTNADRLEWLGEHKGVMDKPSDTTQDDFDVPLDNFDQL